MHYISRCDLSDWGGNGIIDHSYYHKQNSRNLNFNNNPQRPQNPPKKHEDELKLSKENKSLANHLTKETLKHYKIQSSEKTLRNNNEAKKINKGLDYYI